ncbi:MAG: hypothetical protein KC481_18390, partial [Acidimicrobiaceae bacterium]|nr:hypothetical protein [Acidimicrobiaceae bacterium]
MPCRSTRARAIWAVAWGVVLLSQITQPSDLRRLSSTQLDELCQELRVTILDAVAVQGGHLGS